MLRCERLSESDVGTAVTGIDLTEPLGDAAVAQIKAVLAETGVVVFPRAHLSADELLALCAQLGEVRPHPLLAAAMATSSGPATDADVASTGWSGTQGRPEGLNLRIHRLSPAARNDDWHHDLSPSVVPPAASVLQAVQLPVERGLGDTLFSSMYDAHDALSEGLRTTLVDLVAMHLEQRSPDEPPTEVPHPVIRVHPETGRRALYLGSVSSTLHTTPVQATARFLGELSGVTESACACGRSL